MLQCIYLDPRVDKCLDMLRRSGKKALLAAAEAEEIVSRLRSGNTLPNQAGTMTKYGEMRIKGVMKYDLGSGYRLVTYKHRNHFFLLYVGSHDDCHRWLENNRELTVAQLLERCKRMPVKSNANVAACNENIAWGEQEEPNQLPPLGEGVLRRVFQGLVAGGYRT